MFTIEQLDKVIKAYDVRGLVSKEITPDFAFVLATAFARFLQEEREPGTVVIGQDMRPSSEPLASAFADGVTSQGLDVIRMGLASTDMLYFASGSLNLPGVMFTASHNPAAYNGMKLAKSGARPIGSESGLNRIKDLMTKGVPINSRGIGRITERNMLPEYVDFLLSLFGKKEFSGKRKLKVVIDAGNGMAGYIGLAFDGDADRCFLVDEKGDLVNPSTLTSLIAIRELKRKPESKIIYNLISSQAVPEIVSEHGGVPIRSRVGHSYIKKMMADTGAIFGGEHSGHFYFADFWKADSGALAALYAIAELSASKKTLSELLAPLNRYVSSGEVNTKVSDPQDAVDFVKESFKQDYAIDELDGVTVTGPDWWFNVRPSNTEPLLRLNVEAKTPERMKQVRDQVLALFR